VKTSKQTLQLGMPNLNSRGLDEIWLLKFLGDMHWKMLDQILEPSGPRSFYASFFDIQINFSDSQAAFEEFQTFEINSSLKKLNNKIYTSYHEFHGATATMSSIFITVDQQGQVQKYTNSEWCEPDTALKTCIDSFKTTKKSMSYTNAKSQCNKIVLPFRLLFNNANILYFANYMLLVAQSEMLDSIDTVRPIRSLRISYFKNMVPSDSIEAYSKLTDESLSTTQIFVNSEPMWLCEILR